jgi:hypothetical protein
VWPAWGEICASGVEGGTAVCSRWKGISPSVAFSFRITRAQFPLLQAVHSGLHRPSLQGVCNLDRYAEGCFCKFVSILSVSPSAFISRDFGWHKAHTGKIKAYWWSLVCPSVWVRPFRSFLRQFNNVLSAVEHMLVLRLSRLHKPQKFSFYVEWKPVRNLLVCR